MTREPTEMELRVAKAMQDAYALAQKENWPRAMTATMDELNDINRANWLAAVRAGFRAMREPSEEMRAAFDDNKYSIASPGYNGGVDIDDSACATLWQAMIDAASPEEGT